MQTQKHAWVQTSGKLPGAPACPMPFSPVPGCLRLDHGLSGGKHGSQLPTFIKVWFTVDLVVALFAPVHWAMSGNDPILGIPSSLFYPCGTSLIIAASVVATYFADRPFGRTNGSLVDHGAADHHRLRRRQPLLQRLLPGDGLARLSAGILEQRA